MNKTAPTANDLTLVVDRIIDAPRDRIWRCWTDAALLKQWYCPKPWRIAEADLDLRPGGRFNVVMQGPDGERIDVKGIYLDIKPLRKLVFSDSQTEGFIPQPSSFMTGYVELTDAEDGKTRVVWGARHATPDAVQQHLEMGFEKGWNAALDQLQDLARTVADDGPLPGLRYIDGFAAAVPNANRDAFREHAEMAACIFQELGALQVVETWGDDVPDGKVTSFPMAVKCGADETVVFSWIVWPDRDTRNAGMTKMMADPRMQPENNPMPFDGKRMIYGGFQAILDF